MKYNNPVRLAKDEALKILSTHTSEKICEALLSITLYDVDWKLGQAQCLHFLNHENSDVSGLAATCLGHLARIHQNIDKDVVVLVLALKEQLKNLAISDRVQDALDDIEMFL